MNPFRKIKLWHLRRKRRATQKRAERLKKDLEFLVVFLEVLSITAAAASAIIEQQNQKR
jgi:hypothetical protein